MLKIPSHEAFQSKLNQAYILGHTLVLCFVLPVYLSNHQLGVTLYDDLFEDMETVRSILARISSYSASFLEAGKSNHLAFFILSPIRALSCKPTLALVC